MKFAIGLLILFVSTVGLAKGTEYDSYKKIFFFCEDINHLTKPYYDFEILVEYVKVKENSNLQIQSYDFEVSEMQMTLNQSSNYWSIHSKSEELSGCSARPVLFIEDKQNLYSDCDGDGDAGYIDLYLSLSTLKAIGEVIFPEGKILANGTQLPEDTIFNVLCDLRIEPM